MKRYRPNVAAVILSSHYPNVCEFFLGEREDIKGIWQFPQGGIDAGEEPIDALYRELQEEIGTNQIEVIAQYPEWLSYDFPAEIRPKMYPYDGQKQKYFLVRLKPEAKIDLCGYTPEFIRYDFVSYDEIFRRIKSFKREIYLKVMTHFKEKGYV